MQWCQSPLANANAPFLYVETSCGCPYSFMGHHTLYSYGKWFKCTKWFSTIWNALGKMTFAYVRQNVVLDIQATITSTSDWPSKKPMWKGVILGYVIVAACYFPVALVGSKYSGKETTLNAIANMMVVIHVVGSYQVCGSSLFLEIFFWA